MGKARGEPGVNILDICARFLENKERSNTNVRILWVSFYILIIIVVPVPTADSPAENIIRKPYPPRRPDVEVQISYKLGCNFSQEQPPSSLPILFKTVFPPHPVYNSIFFSNEYQAISVHRHLCYFFCWCESNWKPATWPLNQVMSICPITRMRKAIFRNQSPLGTFIRLNVLVAITRVFLYVCFCEYFSFVNDGIVVVVETGMFAFEVDFAW
mmetsp:Transcript_1666/g.4542  ORF Transcript_1666/g.4542 Transcript_1666/m.4542 type:complete len:213 (-) Transcript_1666:154-792(-)